MKGQLAVSGLTLLLLILEIINGSITKNTGGVLENNTYWCIDNDQTALCKNDFILQSTKCLTYLNGVQSCGSGWTQINVTDERQRIKVRVQDFVTDFNGRDWVCTQNNAGGLGSDSVCTFGARTETFGRIQRGV